MNRAVALVLTPVVALLTVTAVPGTANADGCVTHAEFDRLEWGLTTDQVANRFETNGWFIGYTDNDEFFKRGYDVCWANDRKAVVFYDASLGLTDHWDVRDR